MINWKQEKEEVAKRGRKRKDQETQTQRARDRRNKINSFSVNVLTSEIDALDLLENRQLVTFKVHSETQIDLSAVHVDE